MQRWLTVILLWCLSASAQTYWQNAQAMFNAGGRDSEGMLSLPTTPATRIYSTYGCVYWDNYPETIKGNLDFWTADDLLGLTCYCATNLYHVTNGWGVVANTIGGTYLPPGMLGNTNATLWIPSGEGQSVCHYDAIYEWIDALYAEYLKRGTPRAFQACSNVVVSAQNFITISNNLVWVPYTGWGVKHSSGETPANLRYPGPLDTGWNEPFPGNGYALLGSVYRYRAMGQISRMAAESGNSVWSAACESEKLAIAASLKTNLWDDAYGLFRVFSLTNRQHSVHGSAYAVVVGACDYATARKVSATLRNMLPGGTNYTANRIDYSGAITEIPITEIWETQWSIDYTADVTARAWPWTLGWVAKAVALTDGPAADALISEGHATIQSEGNFALSEVCQINRATKMPSLQGESGYPASNCPAQYERPEWFYDAYNWPLPGITAIRTGP